MKRLIHIALLTCLAIGQTVEYPPVPLNVRAVYQGSGSGTIYYYWVLALYPTGQSAMVGPMGVSTAATLDNSNRVVISWTPSPGAIGYDVLRKTNSSTPSGACACAVATRITASNFNDSRNTTSTYTVSTGISFSGSTTSVFGRTGIIVAASSDYTAGQVANVPAGNIGATTVQSALAELDSEKAVTAKGVTNGDSHDHNGGDGAAIPEAALAAAISVAKGGTGQTAATDDAVPVYNGSGTDLKVIPNCADSGGNHINYTQSTNAFSCGTSGDGAGGGGALVLVEQHTASSSASLDFTTCITSTYDEYMIDFVRVVPATSTATLRMRLSSNTGGAWISTSSYTYTPLGFSSGGVGVDAATSTSMLTYFAPASTDADWGISGSGRLYGMLTVRHPSFVGTMVGLSSTGPRVVGSVMAGFLETTASMDAFQIFFSSGNIASGIVRCYGVAK